MARHQGGESVSAGFYLNVDTWQVTTLSGTTGGTLPGGASARFLRVPALAVLAFAPLMGAAYVVFLPFVGIALVAQHAAKRALAVATDVTESAANAIAPAWRPGEAHLTGAPKKDERTDGKAPAASDVEQRLEAIERAIDEKEHADRK